MTEAVMNGGCQCGAVRYRISGPVTRPHLCHCRMCQKAAGNYFMPLANVQWSDFTMTRGEVAHFASSDQALRGFCRDCGTPLTYEGRGAQHFNVVLGTLDDPSAVEPSAQIGLEGKLSWFGDLDALPGFETQGEEVEAIRISNHQHPDHDTDVWPVDRSQQN